MGDLMPDSDEQANYQTVWYDVGIIGAVIVFSFLVYDAGWFATRRVPVRPPDAVQRTPAAQYAASTPPALAGDALALESQEFEPGAVSPPPVPTERKQASGWIKWSNP